MGPGQVDGATSSTGLWLEWERAGTRSIKPLDRWLMIGRDAAADICLDDTTVSLRHAVVSVIDGLPVIAATGSTNGIELERGRTDRAALSLGQSFRIGLTTFRVVASPKTGPGSATAASPMAQPSWPGPHHPVAPWPSRPGMPGVSQGRIAPATSRVGLVPAIVVGLIAVLVVGAALGLAVTHPFDDRSSAAPTSQNLALIRPAERVVTTPVPWDQVAADTTDQSNWNSYSMSSEAFSIKYPSDWAVTQSTDGVSPSVSFYPPGSDPTLPSSNISFLFQRNTAYEAGTSNIHVLDRDGRQIERPDGSLGSPGLFEIDLPYKGGPGTLEISIQQDLSLKAELKAMLQTGQWSE